MDEIDYSEYGSCPNCRAQGMHISQLGNVGAVTCCAFCYQEERDNQYDEQLEIMQFTERPSINSIPLIYG